MDRTETIDTQAENLRALLRKQLGIKSGTLAKRAVKAGRRLPSAVRNDIAAVAEAETMAQHPKLGRRMDPKVSHDAYKRAAAFLQAIDVKDRRKGALLNLAGNIVFRLLVVFALLVVVLRWRGFV